MFPYLFWFKYFVYINDPNFKHQNHVFTKMLEHVGEAFKNDIPGKQSHLRKGERKIIMEVKRRYNLSISPAEIKSLFGSRPSLVRGIHLRIPYTIHTIFEAFLFIIQADVKLKLKLCELLKGLPPDRQFLYRDILLKEFYHAMNLYQSYLSDPRAYEAFTRLRNHTQIIDCP